MNQTFIATHRVRSYEMDSFGHVNNAVYLNYLEYARGEYLLQRGLSFADFERWNALPFVVAAEIQFKAPARVHDFLEIEGSISYWKRTSFSIQYQVRNTTTGKVTAVAEMSFAFVDRDGKLVHIPEEFKEAMS
jgi:YbgC/YbaW family acyl-CoA thioester hydrolase